MKRLMELLTRPYRLAPEDDGAGGITPEQFNKISAQLDGIEKSYAEASAASEDVQKIGEDMTVEVGKIASQVAALKTTLTKSYGPSGMEDWLMQFSKFLGSAFVKSRGGNIPEALKMDGGVNLDDYVQKAAIDFTTDALPSGGTAQYLIPTLLRPGIVELKDLYGGLYPRLTKASVPAGQTVQVNREADAPTATWRKQQLQAMTEEATPAKWGYSDLATELLGTYFQVANELLTNPSVNFAAVLTVRALRGIFTKLEQGVAYGTDSGSEPADGIVVDSSVHDQGNIATATFANVVSFLQACLTDNDVAYATAFNKLFMTPVDALALASEAVGSSELIGMLVWGNPRTGTPTTLLGYEVVVHPAMNDGTTRHMALGDPSSILLGEDASFSIDISPHAGTAFVENASIVRVLNHYDWVIGQPTEWHKTTVGA